MITTVTEEVLQRGKRGFNYMTIPGVEELIENKKETIDECICRIFVVDRFEVKSRRRGLVYAKHLKRHILERLLVDYTLGTVSRKRNESIFKYTLPTLAMMMKCNHSTILHSSRTLQNLIDTDKNFRKQVDPIFQKISQGKIIFP